MAESKKLKGKAKGKRLGIAEDARRYDLPFNKDASTDFLLLLVALMTFLAVMALAASFVLGGMAKRWSSGLENKLTIEVPAETGQNLRSADDIAGLQDKIAVVLRGNPHVKSFDIMQKDDIQNLLEPWLGKDALVGTIPLPGLISVEMKSSEPEVLQKLENDVHSVAQDINVDTHESWLADLLRLTDTLQFVTFIITLIIGGTTVLAVAGGVRSKIAIHKADVELLHLMGASDEYITRQFQRHTLILALQGAGAGLLGSLAIMGIIRFIAHDNTSALLPAFSLSAGQALVFALAPLIAAGIAGLTARLTVLRALSQMP